MRDNSKSGMQVITSRKGRR